MAAKIQLREIKSVEFLFRLPMKVIFTNNYRKIPILTSPWSDDCNYGGFSCKFPGAARAKMFVPIPRISLKNPIFPSKISRLWHKSRFFLQNLVDLMIHHVHSSKISCFCRKSRRFVKNLVVSSKISLIWLKSRGFVKNLVVSSKIWWILQKSRGFEKNLVDFLKISWILKISRGIGKNPVDLKIISWICQKSRGFRSLPGFIDISGHRQIRAVSVFNTDVLLQDSHPFKMPIPFNGRGKHNSHLKTNINKGNVK